MILMAASSIAPSRATLHYVNNSGIITLARSVPIENIIDDRVINLLGKIDRVGPCPRCGGDDRFAINTKKQVWLCRGCAPEGGDGIKLVQHLDDISFPEACEQLSGETFSSKANKAAKPQINPAHKPTAKATAPAQSRSLQHHFHQEHHQM